MQKWRIVLFVGLIFSGVFGALIGLFFAKSGLVDVKIMKLTLFDGFILICLIIVAACMSYDFFKVRKEKKNFGEINSSIVNLYAKRTRIATIIFTGITICELVILAIEPTLMVFCMFLLVVFMAILFINRDFQKSGINEEGILFWGSYFPWSKIKGYTAIEPGQINVVVAQKMLGSIYDNKISLKVKESEFEEIIALLNLKTNK